MKQLQKLREHKLLTGYTFMGQSGSIFKHVGVMCGSAIKLRIRQC